MSRRAPPPPWLAALALVVLGALAYANSLAGPFVLDDLLSIRDNPNIRALWPPARWLSLDPQSSLSGRPVVTLTLALCHAVGGLDVGVYHVTNLALHLLNGVLLLGLLRTQLSARAAFAGALLWTLHPLNTEAVDYLTQRTELLLGTFTLGALCAAAHGRRGVAVLCCALGMLCKESMVTAPIAVLLWQRAYLYGSWRELLAKERWFHAALAATWGILLALLLMAPRSASAGFGVRVSPLDYAQNQLVAVAHYLRLAVWPHPLAIYYGPVHAIALDEWLLPGLLVAGALAGALALFARAPRLGCPAVLFFLLLAPTSSFVPIATEVAAERRMYLPLAALVSLGVGLALEIGRRAAERGPAPQQRLTRRAGELAAAALAIAFGGATFARNADYATAVGLWQSSVTARPELAQGIVNLGIAHAEVGAYREAAAAYRRALALDPENARAHYDLALALDRLGEADAALDHYARAVALEPRFEIGQLALARARVARGDLEGAKAALRRALESLPDSALLHVELAQLLLSSGDPQSLAEALAHARAAASESGERDPAILHTRAAAEWLSGLREDAVRTEERAVELAAGESGELASRLREQLGRYRAELR
ncbi:MAG: tetratricopeptide repeat protein [Myxococcota bacterium]